MSRQIRGSIMLFMTALIWGTAFVAQKSGMDTVSPIAFNGIRTLIGAVSLLPVIAIINLKNKGKVDEELAALPESERELAEKKQKKTQAKTKAEGKRPPEGIPPASV